MQACRYTHSHIPHTGIQVHILYSHTWRARHARTHTRHAHTLSHTRTMIIKSQPCTTQCNRNTLRYRTAQDITEQQNTSKHDTTNTQQHNIGQSIEQHNTTRHSKTQYIKTHHITTQYRAAQYGTAKHKTMYTNTTQYITAQDRFI